MFYRINDPQDDSQKAVPSDAQYFSHEDYLGNHENWAKYKFISRSLFRFQVVLSIPKSVFDIHISNCIKFNDHLEYNMTCYCIY